MQVAVKSSSGGTTDPPVRPRRRREPDLPLWKELPPISYWLLLAAVGIPLIIRALLRHPLARQ